MRPAAIRGGGRHSLALRSDGVVIAWGDNSLGQCNVPVPLAGQSYTELEAGYQHTVLLRSNGEVALLGDNSSGQLTVSVLPTLRRGIKTAAGGDHSIVLHDDGTIYAWDMPGTMPTARRERGGGDRVWRSGGRKPCTSISSFCSL